MNKQEIVEKRGRQPVKGKLMEFADGEAPLSERDIEVISDLLYQSGEYPAGLDACFVNGTMGRCGKNCTAYGSHPECQEDTDEG